MPLKLSLPAVMDGEELRWPAVTLELEHSLVSLSKWEQVHEKPFFGRDNKTPEETQAYISDMIISGDPPENLWDRLTRDDIEKVSQYLSAKHTATTFGIEDGKRSTEVVTSELIYYWMVQFQIPFQPTETWHISNLMTLIKICGIKQSKPKKMSAQERAQQMRELNDKRRREMGTSG